MSVAAEAATNQRGSRQRGSMYYERAVRLPATQRGRCRDSATKTKKNRVKVKTAGWHGHGHVGAGCSGEGGVEGRGMALDQ